MEHANDFATYQDAWIHFLEAVSRLRNKLVEAHGSKWTGPWLGKIRKDPAFVYLEQARNAQGHTITEISRHAQKRPSIIISGNSMIHHMRVEPEPDGSYFVKATGFGNPPIIAILPNRIHLEAVTNWGVRYEPPFRDAFAERGKPLHEIAREEWLQFFVDALEALEG